MCKATVGYALGSIVALIASGFLSSAFASGNSFAELKKDSVMRDVMLPSVTGPALNYPGVYLDARYGMGVRQDTNGNYWDAEGHPVTLFGCSELRDYGIALVSSVGFGFFALLVAGVGHALILFHFKRLAYWFTGLGHITLSTALLVTLALGMTVGSREWTCKPGPPAVNLLMSSGLGQLIGSELNMRQVNNEVLITLSVKKHFNLHFGIPFLIVGVVAAAVAGVLILCGKEDEDEPDKEVQEVASDTEDDKEVATKPSSVSSEPFA
eukprot:Hpha_TRINITY_DN15190_c0_g1::TRINITY_DN15190_c0_g1_i1::g.129970::m.129970